MYESEVFGMINITTVLEALVTLAVAVITVFVIPWIRSKIKAEQFALIQQWADVLVTAAEVLFKGEKMGAEKKRYVIGKLKEKCEEHGMTFSEKELEIILESAWEMLIGEKSSKKEDD